MNDDIKKIDERIKKQRKKERESRKDKPESSFTYASKIGFRIGTELLSGVLVGGAIGFLLDNFFNTKPWLLILFLFLGGIAGFLNVYRFAKAQEKGEN